jgi:hypothetical protein
MLMPVGQFGARRLPHTNPLIGTPDAYPTLYPWGATASGAVGSFDYRVGVMSLPVVNVRYTPEAGHRLRPVAGVGWSAGPAFRVGAAVTRGPYLSSDVRALLPPGEEWTAYTQDIIAAEARFALGYVEVRAEAQWSSYEVPTRGDPVRGFGWYAEVRGHLAPRVSPRRVRGLPVSVRSPSVRRSGWGARRRNAMARWGRDTGSVPPLC